MRDPSYVFIFFFVDSVLCVPVCFLVSSERLPATRQPNRTDPVIDAGFLLPRLNFFVLWRRRPKKTFLARPSIRNHNWLYNNNNWCSSHSVWQIKKKQKKHKKHKTQNKKVYNCNWVSTAQTKSNNTKKKRYYYHAGRCQRNPNTMKSWKLGTTTTSLPYCLFTYSSGA